MHDVLNTPPRHTMLTLHVSRGTAALVAACVWALGFATAALLCAVISHL